MGPWGPCWRVTTARVIHQAKFHLKVHPVGSGELLLTAIILGDIHTHGAVYVGVSLSPSNEATCVLPYYIRADTWEAGINHQKGSWGWTDFNLSKNRDPVQRKSLSSFIHWRGHWPGLCCGKSEEGAFFQWNILETPQSHDLAPFSPCFPEREKKGSQAWLLVEAFLYSPSCQAWGLLLVKSP